MAEQLQHLLDAIQKDGVEKAQAEAAEILAKAKKEAQEILDRAKTQASETDAKAQKEAEKYLERSKSALDQAGRDLLISVSQGIEALLNACIVEQVGQALTAEGLQEILVQMTTRYVEMGAGAGAWDLYLSEADHKSLAGFFLEKMRGMLHEGLEIHPSHNIVKGFRISLREKNLHHDFTQEALAEELARFVQPQLKEIIRSAVSGQEEK
jgi:V/A-type H+/Na+-transporting ATPase subunit E